MSGDNQFNLIANSANRIPLCDLVDNLKQVYPLGVVAKDISNQDSILHRLAKNGTDPDIILELLSHPECGDINTTINIQSKTVLDILIERHMINHLKLLSFSNVISLSDYEKNSYNALHVASRKDNPKMISFLVKEGVNPNHKDKNGYTPLHVARRYACAENSAILERISYDPDILKPKNTKTDTNFGMKP